MKRGPQKRDKRMKKRNSITYFIKAKSHVHCETVEYKETQKKIRDTDFLIQ